MGSAQRSNSISIRDTVRRRHATLVSLLRNCGGRSDEFRLLLQLGRSSEVLGGGLTQILGRVGVAYVERDLKTQSCLVAKEASRLHDAWSLVVFWCRPG